MFGLVPKVDESDDGDEAPSDLEGEGEPAVFREEADGHEDGGDEIEALVENAVFDFVGGEEKVGGEDDSHADPTDNVKDVHAVIIA